MYVAFLLCYVNLRYLLARGNIAELRCCVSIPNDLGVPWSRVRKLLSYSFTSFSASQKTRWIRVVFSLLI